MKISVPNVIEFYWTAKPNTIETFYKRFEFVFQVKPNSVKSCYYASLNNFWHKTKKTTPPVVIFD